MSTINMKRTLLLPSVTLLSIMAGAQCTSSVPPDAVAITSDIFTVRLDQGTHFWLCDSSMAQLFMGANNQFWIEAAGGNNSINSNGNTIYYKGTWPLDVTGNNNTVYAVSADAVELQGVNSVVVECPDGVEFDYSEAPANGCVNLAGIHQPAAASLGVHYDPVNDRVRLRGLQGRGEARLLDMTGRELGRLPAGPGMEWSMAAYPPGYYVVQALAGARWLAKGFVKP